MGALIAAALWTPVGFAFVATGDPRGTAVALAGLVTSPVVGALLSPNAVASRGMGAGTAILFSLIAVSAGGLVFGLSFAFLDQRSPFEAVGFALVSLIFLGIPMLILGTHLALVWVALVRRVAGRRS